MTEPLQDYVIAILLDDLAVSPYLLSTSCDRGRSPYNNKVTDGWRNGIYLYILWFMKE